MRDEMSAEQTVYKTFEFTQNVPNHNPPSSVSGKIWLCFKNRLHSSKSPETIKILRERMFYIYFKFTTIQVILILIMKYNFHRRRKMEIWLKLPLKFAT